MKTLLHIRIPGEPHAKMRPRITRNGSFNPPENKQATKDFQWEVKAAIPNLKQIEKSVRLGVKLVFWTRNQRLDLDNAVKQCFDSGNKFLWNDDVQIEELQVKLWRGFPLTKTNIAVGSILIAEPGTLLEVYEVEG